LSPFCQFGDGLPDPAGATSKASFGSGGRSPPAHESLRRTQTPSPFGERTRDSDTQSLVDEPRATEGWRRGEAFCRTCRDSEASAGKVIAKSRSSGMPRSIFLVNSDPFSQGTYVTFLSKGPPTAPSQEPLRTFCVPGMRGNESTAHRPPEPLWKSCGKLAGSSGAGQFSSLISG
jgi:hypothetical protein